MRNASSHPAVPHGGGGGGSADGDGVGAAHLAAVPAQCAAPQPSESRPIIMKAVTAEAEATQDYSTAA